MPMNNDNMASTSDKQTSSTGSSLRKRHLYERFHSSLMAWVILAISLLLTLTAYLVSQQLVEKRLHEQFDFRALEISKAIEERLSVYEQILWSGVALFYASPEMAVERQQWAAFVDALNIEEHWPGVQGMGYSIPVSAQTKAVHTASIRAEGFQDYQIKPEGERDEYSAIVFLEPFDWRNKRAFGYDMWSNAMRREAMSRARDEGVAASSGVITLVQETEENVQRGFLMYVPVYRSGSLPDSLSERREAFQGWVYAPFRAANLMAGILGSDDTHIVFDVYDGSATKSENLLYSSLSEADLSDLPVFSKTEGIMLQGRPWTIVFRTPADFSLDEESSVPQLVALIGLVIDLLLFYVILSLHYISRRAQAMASDMTLELQAAKVGLEAEIEARTEQLLEAQDDLEEKIQHRTGELQAKVHEMEKMNQLTSGRELRVIELKQEVNELAIELGRLPSYEVDSVEGATTSTGHTVINE